jgi:hypothetical protein
MSEELSVSEPAKPLAMSLTAIMKHLEVLSDPRVIVRAKTGRIVACRLTADPMEWLARYEHFRSGNLDRLAAFGERDEWPTNQAPPARPARSPETPHYTGARP